MISFMNNTLSTINKAACSENPQDFIEICENEYRCGIKGIAEELKNNPKIKIVMIAGPSSSGKTTTAKILDGCLKDLGIEAQSVSLDDFYKNRDTLPKLPNGQPDTENVDSLDIEMLDGFLEEIIEKGISNMPYFDFVTGISHKNSSVMDIRDGGVLIVEGLHALNPIITDRLDKNCVYKIYISAATPIVDDEGNELLSSKKVRFIRRALRDSRDRGADINLTMRMWPQVLKGENKYLYPYKSTADAILKTLHPYELCVYRDEFLKMTENADPSIATYDYVSLIIGPLREFKSIPQNLVPENSLIREFIGGGKYNC